jgi:RNA polymerase sigma factor for flagellar operon FliA
MPGALVQSISVYKESSEETIEHFVQQYSGLVKKIALHLKRRLPSHVELDDLLQSGLLGLLDARENYNSMNGASFETYASIRIRGSIIDSLRKSSSISRDAIKNMRHLSEAISKIEQRNQRPATAEEIAHEFGITLEDYFKMAQDLNFCYVLSLDELDENQNLIGNDDIDPQKIFYQEEIKSGLKKVLLELPEREQYVLSLYYVEELTLKQISEVLSLSEARICQLHSQAIARVRYKMKLL